MSAWRISKKHAAIAVVLVLTVIGVGAGYAAASSRTQVASHLTMSSSTIVKCPQPQNRVHRSGTVASKCLSIRKKAWRKTHRHPVVSPKPTATSMPSPSSSPSRAPSAPPSTTAAPPSATASPSVSASPTTSAPTAKVTAPASPPATTPAASPSPTSPTTAPPSQSQLGPACVTSDSGGACYYTYSGVSGSGLDGGNQTNVIQNIWNPIGGISQTLTAYNPGNWSVTANMPASNKAVVSYPDVQQIYTTRSGAPNPLSGYSSITSSYSEKSPGGGDYEAAYDIWANNGTQEIMIWVDNHGQTPAGSVVGSASIDGVGYQIWSEGRAGAVSTPISMVMDSTQSSGSVNILDDLNWLQSNGYVQSGSGINQIDFGWEICSTAGVPETFSMSQYSLTASCKSGTSCITS